MAESTEIASLILRAKAQQPDARAALAEMIQPFVHALLCARMGLPLARTQLALRVEEALDALVSLEPGRLSLALDTVRQKLGSTVDAAGLSGPLGSLADLAAEHRELLILRLAEGFPLEECVAAVADSDAATLESFWSACRTALPGVDLNATANREYLQSFTGVPSAELAALELQWSVLRADAPEQSAPTPQGDEPPTSPVVAAISAAPIELTWAAEKLPDIANPFEVGIATQQAADLPAAAAFLNPPSRPSAQPDESTPIRPLIHPESDETPLRPVPLPKALLENHTVPVTPALVEPEPATEAQVDTVNPVQNFDDSPWSRKPVGPPRWNGAVFGQLTTLMVVPLLFAVALALAWTLFSRSERNARFGTQLIPVLVANEDLPEGRKLTRENMSLRQVPAELFGATGLSAAMADKLVGELLAVPLQSGDPIVPLALERTRNDIKLGTKIEKHKRVITVSVNETTSVGRWVSPGDMVDVVSALNVSDNRRSATVLQNVQVIAVSATTGRSSARARRQRGPSHVSLLMKPEQAEALALAQELGTVWLTLRNQEDYEVLPSSRGLTLASSTSGYALSARASKRRAILESVRAEP
jgi:pilus assembly protein CpaB